MRPWPTARHWNPRRGEATTRTNGDDDRNKKDDIDPGAGKGDDLAIGRYRQEGISAGVIALGIVALLLLIFIFQNDAKGPISFLFWHFRVRVWGALLVAAALGFVGGYLVAWVRRRRRLARDSSRKT